MKQLITTVISNEKAMTDTCLMWLASPEIANEAKPGQFVMVRCGEGSLNMLRRPISIHQTAGNSFALLYHIVGKGTEWLSKRQANETLDISGPFGNGFSIYPGARNLLLVAGGIGIAPMVFLAGEAVSSGCSVTLLYGARTEHELYSRQSLSKDIRAAARVIDATDDGSKGRKGMVTTLLPNYIKYADQMFACGPAAMYRAMANQRQELLKGKSCQISLEMRMGCGHGVCYSCTIKTKQGLRQVCKDGPVFELDDVMMDEIIC